MFFSWYIKNKHFKAGGNLTGQITPFLLIILVVLLIAAVATVNLGRISLDKTCSANGADAGSLAAASTWAGAFNQLAELNKDLRDYHDLLYPIYTNLYNDANGYINDAIAWLAIAEAAILAMVLLINTPPVYICPSVWFNGLPAAIENGIAILALYQAMQAMTAFNTGALWMKTFTDDFYEGQGWRYCNDVSYMQSSYIYSRKQGLSYAFSNSCVSDKLSGSPPFPTQVDDFSSWLAKDGPYDTGIYSWKDKLEQEHTVSATLDLPDIENFRIQPTKGNYNDLSKLLDDMINNSNNIKKLMWAMIGLLSSIGPAAVFILSLAVFASYVCSLIWPPCGIAYGLACAATVGAHKLMQATAILIVDMLLAMTVVGAELWINSLRDKNNEALLAWEIKESPKSGFPLGKVCVDGLPSDDIKNYMIVKIDEVFLTKPEWKTTCCVEQTHPGITTLGNFSTKYPVVKSCGTSKFDGGDVGTFNDHVEDPSDPYAYNPQIKYDPSMTDAN